MEREKEKIEREQEIDSLPDEIYIKRIENENG